MAIKAPKGRLGEVYHQMLVDAGKAGLSMVEFQRITNITQAYNITLALKKHIEAGHVVRVRPTASRPSWLYAAGYEPPNEPQAKKPRQPTQIDLAVSLLMKAGTRGMSTAELVDAFGDSVTTTSARMSWMERQGLAVSVSGLINSGPRGHRLKTWFIKGSERTAQLKKAAAPVAKVFRLDPKAPAIIPKGLKPIICPGPRLDRYTADPAIAGRGVITEDWRNRRFCGLAA